MKFKVEPDKNNIAFKLQKLVWQAAKKFVKDIKLDEIHLEHPENLEHGDYATNVAMVLAKRVEKKPMEVGKEIIKKIKKIEEIEKIELAKPGFANFWLSPKWLGKQIAEVLKQKDGFGKHFGRELSAERLTILKGKKILLEHTSPDPIKTLHIGHLRNNFLGMTMSRILEFIGAKVTKDCINNDRGIHVCRAMWGYLVFAQKGIGIRKSDLLNFKIADKDIKRLAKQADWKKLLSEWSKDRQKWLKPEDLDLKPDHFDLIVYAVGARAEDEAETVAEQVREILRAWEKEEKLIIQLWRMIIDWSLKGYEKTYARIGSIHDYVWHESELYKGGKNLIYKGLKKGIFKKSKGAIVTNLSKYNLSDTVVIKSDGTALYHTFDINLTLQKRKKFPSDLYIWDIGNDQILYLKQLYAICEQLGIGQVSDFFHLNYGYVYLKGRGKMSSRKGTIIKADELLDEVHKKARTIIETSAPELRKIKAGEKERVAEAVGLGALKYALLKFGREKDVYFDIDKSVSLEGDSGPYLQYTYARAKSVLRKAEILPDRRFVTIPDRNMPTIRDRVNKEEMAILRTIYKFPEVVLDAAQSYAPNLICNFLFDLAQKFNLFYNQHRIIGSANEEARLSLTAAVAQVLKNGLSLLGIKTLERM